MHTVWLLVVTAVVAAAAGAAATAALGRAGRRGAAAPGRGGVVGTDVPVSVLAALSPTVVVLDEDDEVLLASASAHTFNIVRDDTVAEPAVASMVGRLRATGAPQEATLAVARGRLSGAGQFHLRVRVAGLGQGRVLILVEDRTAARRVEEMRRDFVANVSHELKTPVGAILLLAETVEAGADDPGFVRDYAGRVRKEARRLETLVHEVIELTRLQEGDALEAPEDVELDEVLAEAVDRVRVEADSRHITLVSGGTPGLRVRGDAALVTTAVRNLLDNAVRYSDPRTRVAVGTSVDAQDQDLVRIAVVDQGVGIPRDEQERIFERFYRVDRARSRATGGTGLGLSIVKHVAADHGGTVEVWSSPGRGSTFTLVLPRLHPQAPSSPAGADQAEAAGPARAGDVGQGLGRGGRAGLHSQAGPEGRDAQEDDTLRGAQ